MIEEARRYIDSVMEKLGEVETLLNQEPENLTFEELKEVFEALKEIKDDIEWIDEECNEEG